jgi:alpha-galactosidase
MLDPHTAAELDLDQVWALVDELIEAHREWLPDFQNSGIQSQTRFHGKERKL